MKKIKTLSRLWLLGLFLIPAPAAWAAQPSASLSLSSGSYDMGASFSVNIYEDSGSQNVYVVKSALTYDPSLLQFVSITPPGSDWYSVNDVGGNGTVDISRFVLPPGQAVNGRINFATVSFKALANTSKATVDISPSSEVDSSHNIWDGVDNAGTYTFATPVPVATHTKPVPISTPPAPKPQPVATVTPSKPQSGNTLADIKALPQPQIIPQNTPAIYPSSDRLEVLATVGSLIYLAILGWLVRSSHPAAVKVRSIRLRRRRQLDNQTI